MKAVALRALGAVFVLGVVSGCVKESTTGDAHIFTYETWVSGAVLLGGMVATTAGWQWKGSGSRYAWAMFILGPIAALGFAPSMFLDRVSVDPSGFSRRSGIYGLSSAQNVKFTDVTQIRLTSEESRGRRGRKQMNYYIECDAKDGSVTRVPLSNRVVEQAAPLILVTARDLGIPILDET